MYVVSVCLFVKMWICAYFIFECKPKVNNPVQRIYKIKAGCKYLEIYFILFSIYHATPGDTGEYTCTTPAGQSTSVNIIVDNITCPFIPLSRYSLDRVPSCSYLSPGIV